MSLAWAAVASLVPAALAALERYAVDYMYFDCLSLCFVLLFAIVNFLYNKNIKNYKHITYAERTMIETWYNKDHKSKKEIALLLHKSERTIRREINRGKVIVRGYMWEEKEEYSAQIAQEKYEYGMTSKGP